MINRRRDSNMEMMRVFSMFLVLLLHCCFFANGNPYSTLFDKPLEKFYFSQIQSFALVCVDCFILISGFYSIRFKPKSIFNFLFIFFFYKILFAGISIIGSVDKIIFSLKGCIAYIFNIGADWFVWSYLLLLIIGPMINDFIRSDNKKIVTVLLLIYLAIEFLNNFIKIEVMSFNDGFSFISFLGLYIIGRYYRIFVFNKLTNKRKIYCGSCIYLASTFINTILFFVNTYLNKVLPYGVSPIFNYYSNPLIIAGSIGVLIFFSGLNFHNPFVNWLGKSSFAVYLIHLNPIVVPYFVKFAKIIFQQTFPYYWLFCIIAYCVIIYLICVSIDQIRLILWDYLNRIIDRTPKGVNVR